MARRVSPSGYLPIGPSAIQDCALARRAEQRPEHGVERLGEADAARVVVVEEDGGLELVGRDGRRGSPGHARLVEPLARAVADGEAEVARLAHQEDRGDPVAE